MQAFQIIYLSFHVYIRSLVTATKNEMQHILPPVTFEAKKKKKKKKIPAFLHKISDKDEEVLSLSGSVPHACHAQPHRALRVCALLQHTEKVTEKVLNTIPGTQHHVSLRAEKQGSF